MLPLQNKIMLITGASSGIGKCLAEEAAQQGATVLLAARSLDKLKEIEHNILQKNLKAEALVVDLTSDQSIKKVFEQIQKKYNHLDLLINNAAVGLFETVKNSQSKDAHQLFKTNFFGPITCIQQALPLMNKESIIVNISSAIAKHASFYQGVYSASKAALERVSEALRIEENITVLTVNIDRTKTDFRNHVLGPKHQLVLPFQHLQEADPQQVAKKILKAIQAKKSIYHTTLKSRVFTLATALFPSLINHLFRKQYKKVKQI